jgi:hypothetical protein
MLAVVDKFTLTAAVQTAPDNHALRNSGDGYRDAFVAAFLDVYGHKTDRQASEILKRKFLVSPDSKYSENTFLQGASELSVACHVKNRGVTDFETDKKVNPTNNRDVDVFCKLRALSVSTEVKCAEESESNEPGSLYLRTDGRVPNYSGVHEDLRAKIEVAHPDMTLKLAKNKDNALKQFLAESHLKFNPNSGVDDLNILFVACEDHSNMNSWHRYLFGREGLFTANSFSPPQEHRHVDVVILSNLKYRHKSVRATSDWSLQDTLMLPFVNPHRRPTALRDSILNGLSVFEHHLEPFSKYSVTTDDPNVESDILDSVKVIHYVAEQLSEAQRVQYFPTITKWRA